MVAVCGGAVLNRKIRRDIAVFIVTVGASGPLLAQPQDAALQPATPEGQARQPRPGAAARSPTGGVEEIVVTSQKRSENVRKVPLSVTVLSGAQLKAAHIQNFADLTRAVPNLCAVMSACVS